MGVSGTAGVWAVALAVALDPQISILVAMVPIVILIVAWIVARVVRDLLKRLLAKTGMDEAIHAGKSGDVVTRYASALTPSSLIADIVYWFIFLTGLVLAVSALGIDALTEAIGRITAYLPHVIAAILILVVGLAIAGVVGGAITSLLGDTPLGRVGAAVLPVLVVTVALFIHIDFAGCQRFA